MAASILAFRSTCTPYALSASELLARSLAIESLTISADTLQGHYVARAVILDLQPSQMVAALIAVMGRIEAEHRHATRTGWRASSDSLTVYFAA